MTLRTQLALSHLFVIILFAGVFISVVILLTGGAGPSPRSVGTRSAIFAAADASTDAGELRQRIRAMHLSSDFEVFLRAEDGRREMLTDHVHAGRTQSFLETSPLQKGELRGRTLEVASFRPNPPPGSFWNPLRDLLLAASLAGLACIGVAVAVSRFVSKPVAALVRAVESFEGRPPIPHLDVGGPPEIKELADSFNDMADRLSTNMEELRLEKEAAQRSEASRRQFLGEVSHNLRTPLAAIMGWTDSLLDGLAQGQETDYLKRIRRETRYVATTIERLLDLSRWERAQPLLRVEPFPLSEVLLETAENLEEAAAEKSIELKLDLPEHPCWVAADRHRVRDLFQILLENVVQHAGSGVEVEVRVRPEDGRHRVTVTDNGKGLPDNLRHGWQGEPIVAATGRASLGLAIAHHLARAHEGELKLSAGPGGVGSRACFSLPLAPAP